MLTMHKIFQKFERPIDQQNIFNTGPTFPTKGAWTRNDTLKKENKADAK